jgi:gamma-D-glutamyl-L-lysine dipeptidyl-peptidase
MGFGKVVVSVAPVTREAAFSSEMISQLLYGAKLIIEDNVNDKWLQIVAKFDSYTGYILKSQVMPITEEEFREQDYLFNSECTQLNIGLDENLLLSIGSNCSGLLNAASAHIVDVRQMHFSNAALTHYCKKYLGVPYLWGGTSSFGIDCSGFTQSVFRFFNIPLPRDAWQQCALGKLVNGIENAAIGDLAFFKNATGAIIHVGVLLANDTIIHAAGKVRIDKVDVRGIINADSLEQTHQLNCIKRII